MTEFREVKKFEKIAKDYEIDCITLTVNRHNNDTIAVYKKLGFRITGSQVQDIGEDFVMDDYCMEKDCLRQL